MKITTKLMSGFAVIIILTLLLGYLFIDVSENALKNVIGDRSALITEQLLRKTQAHVYNKVELFAHFIADSALKADLAESNLKFEALPDYKSDINKKNTDWVATSEGLSPTARSVLSSGTSDMIREKLLFHENRSFNIVYDEVFITNRYGANVAMSIKSDKYAHADEAWWKKAVIDGYSIGDVRYDENARASVIGFALRIDGSDGDFLGVLRLALNIGDVVRMISKFEQLDGNQQVRMKLLSGTGKVVYSSGFDNHYYIDSRFNSIGGGNLSSKMTKQSGFITVTSSAPDGLEDGEALFAYAHSSGYEDFPELSWVMVVEYDSKDAFAAVATLKQWLVIIITVVILLAVLMSFFVSRAISRPLLALKAASSELGKGDFSTRINLHSNDEMSSLADNFNNMAEQLEMTMKERDKEIIVRKSSEEAVIQMANYDQLTGLPNRVLFMARFDSMIKRDFRKKRLTALFYMDLDRFKTVNDSLGYAAGDELIKAVANRLSSSLRDGDIVARLGGDEFGVLLQDLARVDDLPLVVEKVFASLREPLVLSGEEVSVSCSLGISIFPHDGDSAAVLLKNAEIAMYRAKGDGKNMYQLFTASMATKSMEALRIESLLDTAVERDMLVLHYQPQLSLETGLITGTEALVRLKDPDGGLIPPVKFIDLAEKTGLIVKLGDWVLNTACVQGRAWHDAGHNSITVSVNVSACMFKQKNFVRSVESALNRSGFSAKHLDLEITESVAMTDAEEAIKKMHELKALGVKFSVDDFGTGYSSLSYMKLMPIDMLKIDRSFVNDIMTNGDDRSIITAIITMAHSLGINVIAEGVEERDQLDLLVDLGCDYIQGYYFSKPIPAVEHTAMLGNGSCLSMNNKAV